MLSSINRWFAPAAAVLLLAAAPALAQDKSKPPAPTGNPGTWFTDDDFPAAAKRANQQGRVAVELTIGVDGRVTDCKVVESSGSATLDTTTCYLAETRGTFKPALDAAGKPVTGTFRIATRWVSRDAAVVPIALTGSSCQASILKIDATGKVLTCIGESATSVIAPEFRCPQFSGLSTAFALSVRGPDAGSGPIDVTIEWSLNPDGAKGLRMAYDGPNRVVSRWRSLLSRSMPRAG